MKKKLVAMLSALVVVCAVAIGGTIAYLLDKSDPITNTYTVGKVEITLTQTTETSTKMVPEGTITNDAKVTVKSGSEACYVFVKVEETGANFSTLLTYSLASGWIALDGETGVYYREVSEAVTTDTDYTVFGSIAPGTGVNNDSVGDEVSLKTTAYAIQKSGLASASAAWEALETALA